MNELQDPNDAAARTMKAYRAWLAQSGIEDSKAIREAFVAGWHVGSEMTIASYSAILEREFREAGVIP